MSVTATRNGTPKTDTPVTVDAAMKGLAQSEATWERLTRSLGVRGECRLTIMDPGKQSNGLRLTREACRIAFGGHDGAIVRVEVNRKARKLAVTADPRGDYKLRGGQFGGGTLNRLVVEAGFPVGKYKAECTQGRVEISATGRLG